MRAACCDRDGVALRVQAVGWLAISFRPQPGRNPRSGLSPAQYQRSSDGRRSCSLTRGDLGRQTRLVHPVARACLSFFFRASSSSLALFFHLRRVSPFGPDRRLRLLLLEHPHGRSSSDDRNQASYGKHSQELEECSIRRGRKGVSATDARAAPEGRVRRERTRKSFMYENQ